MINLARKQPVHVAEYIPTLLRARCDIVGAAPLTTSSKENDHQPRSTNYKRPYISRFVRRCRSPWTKWRWVYLTPITTKLESMSEIGLRLHGDIYTNLPYMISTHHITGRGDDEIKARMEALYEWLRLMDKYTELIITNQRHLMELRVAQLLINGVWDSPKIRDRENFARTAMMLVNSPERNLPWSTVKATFVMRIASAQSKLKSGSAKAKKSQALPASTQLEVVPSSSGRAHLRLARSLVADIDYIILLTKLRVGVREMMMRAEEMWKAVEEYEMHVEQI